MFTEEEPELAGRSEVEEMKVLRDYQSEACDYIENQLNHYRKPFVYCLATGAGKSLVISELASRCGQVLVLTLSAELCSQDYEEMKENGVNASVFSASLDQKNVGQITVATVLSAYKNPWLFSITDVVIIDECDAVNPENMNTSFMKLLVEISKARRKDGGVLKIVGLTATPWRNVQKVSNFGRYYQTQTLIQPLNRIPCRKGGKGFLWSNIVEGLNTREAMDRGYLTPINYYSRLLDTSKLTINSTGADYTEESLDNWGQMAIHNCLDVMKKAERDLGTQSGIVALPFIAHAEALARLCNEQGMSYTIVHSKTPTKARKEAIRAFKAGEIKWLVQCGVATVGFNSPRTDTLVWCRPCLSLRLWVQAVGRVMRLYEGKKVANVIDLAGTYNAFGRAEDVCLGTEDEYKTVIVSKGKKLSGEPLSEFRWTKPAKTDIVSSNETNKETRK